MTDLNRRRFLQVAGGTAAASMLSSSIARAAAIPASHRTGSLRDVEHIVVLMQENRSFDHYFGSLRGVRGFGDPRPVTLPSGKPVWYQPDGTRDLLPFRPQVDDLGLQFVQDLPHSWADTHAAWNQGGYDKWVPAKGTTTMAYLTREDIPFHYALADAFTICDAYHCSFLGSTDPNRYYLWTGYTGNDGTGGGPVTGNDERGYSWTTYPERLERAGVSWKIYQDIGDGLDGAHGWGWIDDAYRGNYGDNSLLYFDNYRNAQPGDPLYDKARTGTDAKNGDGFFDILKSDVRAGQLPQVSWVVAPEAFTEHPNWPANYGAWYVSQVLDALTSVPEVWSKTALLITYDENDGFFDHVVPPYPPSSPAQGASTVDTTGELLDGLPYGLGQRVPMLVVSPWSKGGRVCSEVFDHTSVIRFIERRFGVHEPNISPWRRTVSGDLTSAFDFSRTETSVPALPSTAAYAPPDADRHPDYVPTPPAVPALPEQERGRRPALPLPYDLTVDGRVQDGRLSLQFASDGTAGACFHVRSTTDRTGPWSYTVGAGERLSAQWSVSGGYDFTVHGPNGFLRRFAGNGAGVEVSARPAGGSGDLNVVLTNSGSAPVSVTVATAGGYGRDRPTGYQLRPGARVVHPVRTGDTAGWYDLSVTAGQFVRRLAGHVETGRITLTDPGLG
ncbi:phospholipase C, phosphocholine-specific [Amycolatopsis acidiphila]|uniref:phospholipase C n=1 Tax=Amycolatopsis acidiphila TaxID=715473 RepID=A0A558A5J2_9PSEU|nr:phospholipase C, phosphocholine-specific [Amycolatopsis acidiphila]TVT19498.1 phospholipase C, phosphocholine-specific [Amycolatopsis acidiphila]UIJ56913.1 phospholipase C, phosphocholine-specific [Amycolatopsis acidiphila]GHG54397.1 phospholipase C, phosphocholine-specific [Amycolatopsis acidiphila]